MWARWTILPYNRGARLFLIFLLPDYILKQAALMDIEKKKRNRDPEDAAGAVWKSAAFPRKEASTVVTEMTPQPFGKSSIFILPSIFCITF